MAMTRGSSAQRWGTKYAKVSGERELSRDRPFEPAPNWTNSSRRLPLAEPSAHRSTNRSGGVMSARCRAAIATRDDFRLRVAVSRCFSLSLSLLRSGASTVTHMADAPFKARYGTRSSRDRRRDSCCLEAFTGTPSTLSSPTIIAIYFSRSREHNGSPVESERKRDRQVRSTATLSQNDERELSECKGVRLPRRVVVASSSLLRHVFFNVARSGFSLPFRSTRIVLSIERDGTDAAAKGRTDERGVVPREKNPQNLRGPPCFSETVSLRSSWQEDGRKLNRTASDIARPGRRRRARSVDRLALAFRRQSLFASRFHLPSLNFSSK